MKKIMIGTLKQGFWKFVLFKTPNCFYFILGPYAKQHFHIAKEALENEGKDIPTDEAFLEDHLVGGGKLEVREDKVIFLEGGFVGEETKDICQTYLESLIV